MKKLGKEYGKKLDRNCEMSGKDGRKKLRTEYEGICIDIRHQVVHPLQYRLQMTDAKTFLTSLSKSLEKYMGPRTIAIFIQKKTPQTNDL